MVTNAQTAPGAIRHGEWVAFYDRVAVRVHVVRGFDCREVCEHVPKLPNEGGQRHGQHYDEYGLACRRENIAAELTCFSRIRNAMAEPAPWSRRPVIHPAYLHLHRRAHGKGKTNTCHIFSEGCFTDSASLLSVDQFWSEEESGLLYPIVLKPVDAIDLKAAANALGLFWPKLIEWMDKSG